MRAPRTHRRRRLPRPPAAQQQQHHAAHGRAAAPPPPLHPPTRSGAPGAALRRGHTRRGSAAPAGVSRRPPLCRARPLLPTQVLPGLLWPRNIHPHPAAGAWRACAGRAGCRLSRKGRASPPQPFPPGAGLLAAARARARLSPPHTSTERAQPPDPALFSAAEAARGAGGGAAVAAAGRTSGGAVRLSRAATLPGPALPSPPLRCGASAQTAQTFSVRAGGGPGGGGPRSRTVQ